MSRRTILKATALGAFALAASSWLPAAFAADTIKVGILHSLSGTMAISETSLKDVALMTIDEINANGGVNGKKLEPVIVDPASNWPLFAEKARQLISQDKVSVVFGCWTSVSRKSVLPVFKELNSLLFYPVQYEGEELEKNVFYTGAAPNQQAIPATEYLMSKEGGGAKRFVLLGTDYVYPRTTNKILRAFLHSKGVADKDIEEVYTPFGHSDYQTIVANIKKFSAGGKTAVISTVNGDSNVPFYKELANQGLKATDVPVVAFSVGEEELRGIDTKPLVGQLAAWNYFESLDNPVNKKFVEAWKAYAKAKNLPNYQTIVANIKKFSAGGKTAVVSTINGDSNVPFYKELANQGLKATDVPVVAFSVGEEELRGIDTKPLVGNLAAWNYFESVDNPTNQAFVADYKAYAKAHKLPNADTVVTNDPMEATYVGIHMWAQAVEKAGTTDVDKVRAAMAGQSFKAPSGFTLTMDATNHHLHKPVMIGEIEGNGQFNVVWQTEQPVRAQPWSPFIAGNDKKPDQPMKTASN